MQIPFYKYHGTGNDFILIDDREEKIVTTHHAYFRELCDRRFGIGADGLILLRNEKDYDFRMDYFNADGKPGSMCGNGGRCAVKFASALEIIGKEAHFLAVDGEHEAVFEGEEIKLKMTGPVGFRQISETDYWVDTGSPHYVRFTETDVEEINVISNGREIRNSEPYRETGTNVNFVNVVDPGLLRVRTYERGVEDETYSCGTGVTAVAWIYTRLNPEAPQPVQIRTTGGTLRVHIHPTGTPWLQGPAAFVFQGLLPKGP